ncbi:MAG TPA: hypothetical protein VJM57_04680 [Thermodesulfobacteriota bacterium]|nr:hypothetical protein [Thermodesulfobacteriota bacterium]
METGPIKGAASRVFGFALISLAFLNSLFSLKTGALPGVFNYLIIASGLLFLGIGLLKSRHGSSPSNAAKPQELEDEDY